MSCTAGTTISVTGYCDTGGGGSGDLQDAYDASAAGVIIVDNTRGGMKIMDATVPISTPLLRISDNLGAVVYLAVTPDDLTVPTGLVHDPTGIQFTQQNTNPGSGDTIWINSLNNHLMRGGVDIEAAASSINLQAAYDSSPSGVIQLDGKGALILRDFTTPGTILAAQNATGTTTYFSVDATGTTINGKLTVTGLIDPTGLVLTPQASNPSNAATLWINSATGQLMRGATNVETLTSAVTLQTVYTNSSTTPRITLSASGGAFVLRDASTPLGGSLFAVQNNAGSVSYFAVTSAGAVVDGDLTVTDFVNAAVLDLTAQVANPGDATTLWISSGNGHLYRGSVDIEALAVSSTLQSVYNTSSSGTIVLDATRGAFTIRDASPSLAAALFAVVDTAGTTTLFNVTPSGISAGNLVVSNLRGTTYTAQASNPGGAATVWINSGTSHLMRGAVDLETMHESVTLQTAYAQGTSAILTYTTADGALILRDASTPLGTALFAVQNNAGGVSYFAVTASGAAVTGNMTVSGTLTTTGVSSTTATTYTAQASNPGGASTVWVNSGNNHLYLGATDLQAVETLQATYAASTNATLTLTAGIGALILRDASSPLGGALFAVQNNAGGTSYFAVTASGVAVTGTMTVSSTVSTTGVVLTAQASNPGATTTVWVNSGNGHLYRGSVDIEALAVSQTLQAAYAISTNATLTYASGVGALILRDGSTPLGTALFAVQNNAGSVSYFAVTATGASVTGTMTVSGVASVSAVTMTATASNPGGVATVWINSSNGHLYRGSVDVEAVETLQATYNASSSGIVTLSSGVGTLILRDASTPLGTALFAVQNNAGGVSYFAVTATGASVTGTMTVSGVATTGATTLTATASNPGGATTLWANSAASNQLHYGSVNLQAIETIQATYAASANSIIGLTSGVGGLILRDASTPLGTTLFAVQNNAGAVSYFAVTSAGTSTSGTSTTIGTILTAQASNPGGATTLWANSGASNQLHYGSVNLQAVDTLQATYAASTNATLTLTSGVGALILRDASSPLGGSLFAVQNNAGSVSYFAVTSAATSVVGKVSIGVSGSATIQVLSTVASGYLVLANNTTDETGGDFRSATIRATSTLHTNSMNTVSGSSIGFNARDLTNIATVTATTMIATLFQGGAADGATVLSIAVTADTFSRLQALSAGELQWSSGAIAHDVMLRRSAVGTLTLSTSSGGAAAGTLALGTLTASTVSTPTITSSGSDISFSSKNLTSVAALTASGRISTTSDVRLNPSATSSVALFVTVAAEANPRWAVRGSGVVEWGAGTTTRDTFLARTGAATLSLGTAENLADGTLRVGTTVTTSISGTTNMTLTAVAANPGGATTLWANSGASNQIFYGSVNLQAVETIQATYAASTNSIIGLTSGVGALILRDASTPLGGALFAVQNNAGSTSYFAVTATGISTSGTVGTVGVVLTAQASNPGGATTVWVNSGNGHLYRGSVDVEAVETIQATYAASTNSIIGLTSGVGALILRDASTPLGGALFAVQSNDGATSYLAVTNGGASVNGAFAVTGITSTLGVTLSAQGANPGNSATVWINSSNGQLMRGNVNLETQQTLQQTYTASANGIFALTAAVGALLLRDASTPLGGSLFAVQNNLGSVTYFSVSAATVTANLPLACTSTVTTTGVMFTTQASNPGSSATVWVDTATGHLMRGSVDLEAIASGATLQTAYAASTGVIGLTSGKPFVLRDAVSSIGTMFAVQDSAGSTTYFSVSGNGDLVLAAPTGFVDFSGNVAKNLTLSFPIVANVAAATKILTSKRTTDTYNRYEQFEDGTMTWSANTVAIDTALRRYGAGELALTSAVAGTSGGKLWTDQVGSLGATLTLTATTNISGDGKELTNTVFNNSSLSSGSTVITTRVSGDAQPRWLVTSNGVQSWGSGAGSTDLHTYRGASGALYVGTTSSNTSGTIRTRILQLYDTAASSVILSARTSSGSNDSVQLWSDCSLIFNASATTRPVRIRALRDEQRTLKFDASADTGTLTAIFGNCAFTPGISTSRVFVVANGIAANNVTFDIEGNGVSILGGSSNTINTERCYDSTILYGFNNSITGVTTSNVASVLGGENVDMINCTNCILFGKNMQLSGRTGNCILTDAEGTTYPNPGANNSFECKFVGGYYFKTNNLNTTGVQCAGGASSWSGVSDRRVKCDFVVRSHQGALDALDNMTIEGYRYIDNPRECAPAVGPMAQDFYNCFGQLLGKKAPTNKFSPTRKNGQITTRTGLQDGDQLYLLDSRDESSAQWLCIKALRDENRALQERVAKLEAQLAGAEMVLV